MLCKRLIAVILIKDGWVVQSINFKLTNVVGDAYTAVDFYNTWTIDELILLDVSRTMEHRDKFLRAVEKASERCFIPMTVGGWIKSVEDIRELLSLGADKVVINTETIRQPSLITDASQKFGSQCIVVSIDEKNRDAYIDRGRTPLLPVLTWVKETEKLGAGEILLRSIDRDGTGTGYDLDLIRRVSKSITIPLVVGGGVGKWEHLGEGLDAGADGVAVANKFHFTEHSTKQAREWLLEHGYNIRPTDFVRNEDKRTVVYDER